VIIGGRFQAQDPSRPLELTCTLIERIERLDPKLNAFVTVTADRALADAKAAETALARGDISSPLLGIPSATRTSTRPAASSPPAARRSWPTGCRARTRRAWLAFRKPAR